MKSLLVFSFLVASFSASATSILTIKKSLCGSPNKFKTVCVGADQTGKEYIVINETVHKPKLQTKTSVVSAKVKDLGAVGSMHKTYTGKKGTTKYELVISHVVYPKAPYNAQLTVGSAYSEFEMTKAQ